MHHLNYKSSELLRTSAYSAGLHWLAVLTALATFPLIFMGGLVTSHHAGMSVPDWPNSYGYNMFLFPPRLWVGGIWFEHVHRLMGTVVGFFAIFLAMCAWGVSVNSSSRRKFTVSALLALLLATGAAVASIHHWGNSTVQPLWPHFAVGFASLALVLIAALFTRRREPRRWVRWLSLYVLATVILQGILGGTRVTQVNLTLAIIHGCVAQAFFCLAVFTAIITSRWWIDAPDLSHSPNIKILHRLIGLAITAVAVVFGQLVVGALMRHYQAGLAIPGILVYGNFLPPTSPHDLVSINHLRVWTMDLDPVTLGQIWLHFAHRVGALLVTIVLLMLIMSVLRYHRNQVQLMRPAMILLVLLLSQLTLGVLTVYYRKPADVTSIHVAVGALVLATSFVIAVRAMRLYCLRRSEKFDPQISQITIP